MSFKADLCLMLLHRDDLSLFFCIKVQCVLSYLSLQVILEVRWVSSSEPVSSLFSNSLTIFMRYYMPHHHRERLTLIKQPVQWIVYANVYFSVIMELSDHKLDFFTQCHHPHKDVLQRASQTPCPSKACSLSLCSTYTHTRNHIWEAATPNTLSFWMYYSLD